MFSFPVCIWSLSFLTLQWFRNTVGFIRILVFFILFGAFFNSITSVRWHQSLYLLMRSSKGWNDTLRNMGFSIILFCFNIDFDLTNQNWFLFISDSLEAKNCSFQNMCIEKFVKKSKPMTFQTHRTTAMQLTVMFISIGADRIAIRMKHRKMQQFGKVHLCYFTVYLLRCICFPASHSLSCIVSSSSSFLVGSIAYIEVHSHLLQKHAWNSNEKVVKTEQGILCTKTTTTTTTAKQRKRKRRRRINTHRRNIQRIIIIKQKKRTVCKYTE